MARVGAVVHASSMQRAESTRKKHLIVLSNGLWGQARHWDTVQHCLVERLKDLRDDRDYVVHVSTSNQRLDTYRGIDVCGDRLKDELDELVRVEHPDAEVISFLSHSMGGLIARNAVHKLFDRESKKLVVGGCHLEPMHYCSLATPHVGFADQEVCPLSRAWWLPFSSTLVPFVSSRVLGDAGKQFFHRDESRLIMTMASEEWLQGLGAFKTRTCYGNVCGDHLVGWGNSSLRLGDELREIEATLEAQGDTLRHRGVVWEESPDAAVARGTLAPHVTSQDDAIRNLQALGWRRIDVSFRDAPLSGLAHQHIMVQRKRLNRIGRDTARHVAEQFHTYERRSQT